jgi:hypothetical protein
MQVGADGFGQHSLNADRSGRLRVRLLRLSPVNAILSTMFNLQTTSAALHGQNSITITDKVKGDLLVAQQVAFTKHPAYGFGKEAGVVEWEFAAVRVDLSVGVGL